MNAFRHFLQRFNRKENAVNPEDQAPVEETQDDAADSPPAEEAVEEAPADPPVEATDVAPAAPVLSLDDRIVEGSANIQAKVAAFRQSKTAQHDAQMALASAQAAIDAADGAEQTALDDATAAIDAQIANLTSLRSTLNA